MLALLAAKGAKLAGHLDLENPRDLGRLEDPLATLEGLQGLVIIDEIQRRPPETACNISHPRKRLPPSAQAELGISRLYQDLKPLP